MIALTFVAALLLSVVVVQWIAADKIARRRAVRHLRARGIVIASSVGEELVEAIARRLRRSSAGGAIGLLLALAGTWVVVRDPDGLPGLAAVGIVLTSLLVGYSVAVVLDVVATTPTEPPGVRVAGLTPRDPHTSAKEARAEWILVGVAASTLAVTLAALALGADQAATAVVCAFAAIVVMLATGSTRRWMLAHPAPAADTDHSVATEVLVAATADELTENLIANGSLLVLYAVVILAPGVTAPAVVLLLGLLVTGGWALATAAHERRRSRRVATR